MERRFVPAGEARPSADLFAEVAIRDMDDPDPKVGEVAIAFLPRSPDEPAGPWLRALPAATSALSGGRREVRLHACDAVWALTVGGAHADEGVAALVPLLDDSDPEIREAVAGLLPKYGAGAIAALPALIEAGGGQDGPYAAQVAQILRSGWRPALRCDETRRRPASGCSGER